MLNRLVLAALLLCAGAAHAAPEPRDLDGNGSIDAYYDSGQNLTWLAQAAGSGRLSEWDYFRVFLPEGIGWRLPVQNDFTTPLENCEIGSYFGSIVVRTCTRPVTPDSSEVSRFVADGGGIFGGSLIWGSGGMRATHPDLPGQYFDMFPMFHGEGYDLFVFDASNSVGDFWAVADGDHGAVVSIPEPASWMLLLLGLLLVHVVAVPRRAPNE